MRVRIKQLPHGTAWAVEIKESWLLQWREVERFAGDGADKDALAYAQRLKNPLIVEIGDKT